MVFCEEEKKHFFQKSQKVPKNRKNRPKISQFDDQNRQKVDPKKEKMEKKNVNKIEFFTIKNISSC